MNSQPTQGTADYNEGYANGYGHGSMSKTINYAEWKRMQASPGELLQYREYMAGWKQGWSDRDNDDRRANPESYYAKRREAEAEWEAANELGARGNHPYTPNMPDDAIDTDILRTAIGPMFPPE